MDTYGGYGSGSHDAADELDLDDLDEIVMVDQPPPSIGTDERRMQVRAYNFWASMLGDRNFPSIEDLDPEDLPDFGPNSVLLDFTGGLENPAIQFLGTTLADECGANSEMKHLDDIPSLSLLSRITDHYMQILANQAPIGFEAEFVNQRGLTILYRGILLPFSSDDESIDFIYGVINWKELADPQTTDALLLEVDEALEDKASFMRPQEPLTDWADGPADGPSEDDILDLVMPLDEDSDFVDGEMTADWTDSPLADAGDNDPEAVWDLPENLAELPAGQLEERPMGIPDLAAPVELQADMQLADWLASARELAAAALGSEDRTRGTLYSAIGRAYDFSLAAAEEPDQFQELLSDSGLTMQDRAPLTPIVKLIFGAEYDKTRLTEYAAALGHAHRLALPRGGLSGFLNTAPGGLKGIVTAERKLRREESGKVAVVRDTPRNTLARKLRKLDHVPLSEVASEGSEFGLLVIRRLANGTAVLLGEVSDDVPLLEKVAKKLLDQTL